MFHHKKTKIVTTIGPASGDPEIMKQLMLSGANVFRFNMKHNTHASHVALIKQALRIAKDLGRRIGVLIELQGPEVRISTPHKNPVLLKKGEQIKIGKEFTDEKSLKFSHPEVVHALNIGDDVLIEDGNIETKVVEKNENYVVVESVENYEVIHRKGVNLPNIHLDIPALTEDDLLKLDLGKHVPIDYLGYSFVRSKADIDILKFEMKKRELNAGIVSKIESQTAVDNLDEIIAESDAVMVARGDLGIEVPFEQLAFLQKTIIKKCRVAHTPVITATQMLESMIANPRPTRAEATDVANAVFDGTDAVMLSGESAMGKYPVKAVQTLSKICAFSEPKARLHADDIDPEPKNEAELIVHAARSMVDDPNHPRVDAVIVFTETGYTAKLLARFRPERPVIAVSRDEKVVAQLQLVYGIHAVYCPFPTGVFTSMTSPNPVLEQLKADGIIMEGEKILIVHGQYWQNPGAVNTLSIITI